MSRDSFQIVFHAIKASQAYAQFDDPDIASNLFKLLDSLERDLIGSYTPSDRTEEVADTVEASIQTFLESQEEDEEPVYTETVEEEDDEDDLLVEEGDEDDDEDDDLALEEQEEKEDEGTENGD